MLQTMSQYGAALQTYNQELVKCIEELKKKRGIVQSEINKEEREKSALEAKQEHLSSLLAAVNESLSKKLVMRDNYDKTITDSEATYMKILESSQTLLTVVKRESSALEEIVRIEHSESANK